jgi:hypothetical protein
MATGDATDSVLSGQPSVVVRMDYQENTPEVLIGSDTSRLSQRGILPTAIKGRNTDETISKVSSTGTLSILFPNPTTTDIQFTTVFHNLSATPVVTGYVTRMGDVNNDIKMPIPALIPTTATAAGVQFSAWAGLYATSDRIVFWGMTSFTDDYYSGIWTVNYGLQEAQ